ncbi:MAG: CDP-diacylglycerol--serine O-phosphatidyltransferase [Elusimicrobia bacterium]|nr:CDP-diacylglycerol--serine O-phosphatidyltransferase [Elusimicrobiota bacterium]
MDKGRLKRSGQLLAPSVFTMGNMACGFYALNAANVGDFPAAATAILGGIAFDMLDGRVARLVHGESSFGVEFDSMSDFLTFGVAPANMMCQLLLKDYGVWGYVVAFIYALCGGLRLARFNAVAHAGKGSKSHFQGLPIPAAAGFLASFVLLYHLVETADPSNPLGIVLGGIVRLAGLGPLLVAGLGLLMVSSIPYGAFKQVHLLDPANRRLLLVVAAALTVLWLWPSQAVFVIFLLYVLSGLAGVVVRRPSRAKADD